jgi:hypothetical protein
VIWGDVATDRQATVAVAWEVAISNVAADGSGPIGRYYIDAKTGAVLHYTTTSTSAASGCTNGRARGSGDRTAAAARRC